MPDLKEQLVEDFSASQGIALFAWTQAAVVALTLGAAHSLYNHYR